MTFYIENLGCAKNQVDAEVIANDLISKGYKCINDDEDAVSKADVIIVNTCAFIESARKEAIDVFFELNNNKKDGAKIIITGCLGERYKADLEKELKEADEIRGVPKVPSTKRGDVLFSPKGTAYLKISEGCNHYCAFCAIPLIRGPLKSICEKEIVDEAKRLIKSGIKEINIIGQDLATYGKDLKNGTNLSSLLKKLISLDGDFKLRCLYIHPDFFDEEILSIIKESNGRIIPYFDIPIQHCNSEILHNMGRVKTKDDYKALVKLIRSTFEDSYIRTTFLIGFKGESEETLQELEDYIKDVQFDAASFFLYSREEGTRGYDMMTLKEWKELNKCAKKAKKKLEDLQDSISSKRLERFVNKVYPVLVEENIDGTNLCFAHTSFQCPDTDGTVVLNLEDKNGIVHNVEQGEIVNALITKVNNLDLEGVIV